MFFYRRLANDEGYRHLIQTRIQEPNRDAVYKVLAPLLQVVAANCTELVVYRPPPPVVQQQQQRPGVQQPLQRGVQQPLQRGASTTSVMALFVLWFFTTAAICIIIMQNSLFAQKFFVCVHSVSIQHSHT